MPKPGKTAMLGPLTTSIPLALRILLNQSAYDPMPRHVGIIMDGNGRWAQQQDQPRVYGHNNATNAVQTTVETAADLGVEVLTLFAFSTENWKRPAAEIDALMELFTAYLQDELPRLMKNNIRLTTIGSKGRLPDAVTELLASSIDTTKNNSGMVLCLAVDYGSRDEITRMTASLVASAAKGELSPEDVTEALIEANLDTVGLPELDLVIRTSGEQRLSNFLLWQAAYAEFYYTDTLWPDFDEASFKEALLAYSKRNRRIGAIHGT